MKSQKDIYNIMDTIKPYLQKIVKDADGMSIQIVMAGDGRGQAVLYEVDRDVEHQHFVDLDEEGDAYNWRVNHVFADNKAEQYHAEVDYLAQDLTAGMAAGW